MNSPYTFPKFRGKVRVLVRFVVENSQGIFLQYYVVNEEHIDVLCKIQTLVSLYLVSVSMYLHDDLQVPVEHGLSTRTKLRTLSY